LGIVRGFEYSDIVRYSDPLLRAINEEVLEVQNPMSTAHRSFLDSTPRGVQTRPGPHPGLAEIYIYGTAIIIPINALLGLSV
jgi:hypothetical protein